MIITRLGTVLQWREVDGSTERNLWKIWCDDGVNENMQIFGLYEEDA